uniref:Protein FAM83D n=1 Tax=Talaromyces marneffei PM1 TaxID=1077442 RepID=A0A093V751_TALMA
MTSSTPTTTTKTVPITPSRRWSFEQYLTLLGEYLASESTGYYFHDHRTVDDLARRPLECWTPRIGDDDYTSSHFQELRDRKAWDGACEFLTLMCRITIHISDLREQLHYLLDSLERISAGDYIQSIERNVKKQPCRKSCFTTKANFVAVGISIGIYVRPARLRWSKVNFEALAAVLNRCDAFSEHEVDAAQVKHYLGDIWSIFNEERNSSSLLPPPSLEKRRSTEELTSVQSKQTKLA